MTARDVLVGILGTDPLEQAAALFGVLAVWLSVKQKVWNWPVGMVNVALYAIVFWRAKLYADTGLQVVYFVLALYGWYAWLFGGTNRSELRVTRTPPREAMLLAIGAALLAGTMGSLLHRGTDAALPYLDSSLTAASLAAQWLLTRKRLENWLVWIVADAVYVGMFLYKGLRLTAVLYLVFLVLAILGWRAWRASLSAPSAGSDAHRARGAPPGTSIAPAP